ncbi:MAG TPA: S53 family peptidase [Chloroflexota bacterium]|nr:S53 family peptidase [Chloroflexota bacterium]
MQLIRLVAALVAATVSIATSPLPHRAAVPAPPGCVASKSKPCFDPAQLRSLYDTPPIYASGITGRGETIAVIVSFGDPRLVKDVADFDRTFRLPALSLRVEAPLGHKHSSDDGWQGETALDVEWAHAMAPGARIIVLESPVDETEGVQGLPQFLTLERDAVRQGADIVNQSWGATEDTLLSRAGRAIVRRFDAFYASESAKGIVFTTGSGDDGAAGLDDSLHRYFPYRVAQWPASNPHVLSVGGTRIESLSPPKETAWDRSGGGFSRFYPEPCYQKSLPHDIQMQLNGRRGYPDVAFDGAGESPVATRVLGHWYAVAGTSLGSPAWAGIMALADQKAGRRLGDMHDEIYRLGLTEADFRDITSGAIQDPPGIRGTETPLHAGPGWDVATGFGTPDVAKLVGDLSRTPAAGCS